MRNLFTLILTIVVATTSWAQCDLFFSEYIEGSSSNKALEIYNPTGATVDLSNYVVCRSNNGATTASYCDTLSGMLMDGDVYVIVNPFIDTTLYAGADTISELCFFNGDDAVYMINMMTGDTTDIIGEIGIDPGTNWTVGTGATSEFTLVRMSTVSQGNTDWTTAVTEWDVYTQNDFSNLGMHTGTSCATGCAPTFSTQTETSCGDFVWGVDSMMYTTTGMYMDTLVNAAGCDSVITLDLTIMTIDTSFSMTLGEPTTFMSNEMDSTATFQWMTCDSNGVTTPIVGETSNMYTPMTTGYYSLEITVNGCVMMTNCMYVDVISSINEVALTEEMVAYPNPTMGATTVDLGKAYNGVEVVTRNMVGQVVDVRNFDSVDRFELNINGTGIFVVTVTTENGNTATFRLVKQ